MQTMLSSERIDVIDAATETRRITRERRMMRAKIGRVDAAPKVDVTTKY
jgi:hypothetical protein